MDKTEEIRERWYKATNGQWEWGEALEEPSFPSFYGGFKVITPSNRPEAIKNAPEDIKYLLEENEKLREARWQIKNNVDRDAFPNGPAKEEITYRYGEPWKFFNLLIGNQHPLLVTDNNIPVAMAVDNDTSNRIRACVNFCAGYSTAYLYDMTLWETKQLALDTTIESLKLCKENEKLREALKFYANEDNYSETHSEDNCDCCRMTFPAAIYDDCGERAKQALQEAKS